MEIITSVNRSEQIIDLVKRTEASDDPAEFWQETVALARDEENSKPINLIFPNVGVEEIITFGEKIRHFDSINEKYKLMLEKTESGVLWYDVLLGEGNVKMFSPTEKVVKQRFLDTNTKWKRAADIGTGTGNALRSIAPYCEHVYGVDFALHALRSGKEIGLPDNASLVVGKANELPFADHSMDLVVSSGLIYYLSFAETKQFIHELSRVLSRRGRFFHSSFQKKRGEIVAQPFHYVLESGKGALLNIVGGMANENGHPESLYPFQFQQHMLESGDFKSPEPEVNDSHVLYSYTRK